MPVIRISPILFAAAVRNRVHLVDHDDLYRGNVRVHRDVVIGKITLDHAPKPVVTNGVLGEGEADTPDDAAEILASCGLGIQDITSRKGGNDAADAQLARALVDTHFHKLRAERVARIALPRFLRLRLQLDDEEGLTRPLHDVAERVLLRLVLLGVKRAVGRVDLFFSPSPLSGDLSSAIASPTSSTLIPTSAALTAPPVIDAV